MLNEHPAISFALLGGGAAIGGTLMYRVSWTRHPTTPTTMTTVRLVPFAAGGRFGVTLIGNTP